MVELAPRERVQQTIVEETVEVDRLVLHERVQQRTAEQFEDAPQHPEETVEMVRSVSHERVQQGAAEQQTAEKLAKYRRRQVKTSVCTVPRMFAVWPPDVEVLEVARQGKGERNA